MKRIIIVLSILILIFCGGSLAWAASDMSDAKYLTTIQIANSGTALTNAMAVLTLDTPDMITQGMLNDTATDLALLTGMGGTDIAVMPGIEGNPWVMMVSSIGASATINQYLYSADCTGGKIRYFPDTSGMTTSDHATLELGVNFAITQSGWVDTSQSSNKNLLYKGGAFKSTAGGVKVSQNVASTGFGCGAAGSRIGQRINSMPVATIASVQFYLYKAGTPTGTGYARLRKVSDDSLIGTFGSIDISTIPTSADWFTFNTAVVNTAVQDVRVTFEADGGGGSEIVGYYATDRTVGNFCGYNGSSWADYSGDFCFRMFFSAADCIGSSILGASPSVALSNTSSTAAGNTNHTVNLPSSIASGDLLLIFFQACAASDPTISWPSGWTQIFSTNYGTLYRLGAAYKVAAGTEESSVTVTTGAAAVSAHASYRIASTDYVGTPVCGTTATGTNANPDPPNLTHGFGTVGSLYIAVAGCADDGDHPGVGAWPTSYTFDQLNPSGSTAYLAVCGYKATSTGDNPAAYTVAGDGSPWAANTIAIQGAAPQASVFTTGKTSDEYVVKTTYDGSNLKLFIDDLVTAAATSAWSGSIPDTSYNYASLENGAMAYMEYQDITISSTQQQYIEWDYGATFDDQSAGNHDATPTFRTTASDADLTASISGVKGLLPGSPPTSNFGEGATMVSGTLGTPSNLFVEGSKEYKIGEFDIGQKIDDAAKGAGQDPVTWHILFAIGLALLVLIAIYRYTHNTRMGQKGSLILAGVAAEGVLIYFYRVTTIPGLALIPFGIITLLLIVWRKSPSPAD